ncbi:MAG: AAA family ATPase [Myxococcales bacterium]
MNLSVAVYQRRTPGGFRWVTLGLGPHNRTREGQSPTKLQRKIVDDVRNAVAAASPSDLVFFRMPQGVHLERERLELSLRGSGGHRRASGLFPLVLETRWRSSSESMTIAYHPERQDEWFPVRADEALDVQANAYFSQAWADLEEDAVTALQSDRKDGLRVVSFAGRPKSLLERIGKKNGIWDDLEPAAKGAPPKKKGRYKVLDRIGVNLTAQAIEGTLEGGMPRSPYREQLELLLGGQTKTPVLLVGPPGVGKRTLLRRFACDRLENDGWTLNKNLDDIHEVWSVAGKRIIAGMSYVGDWEQRCLELLEDARDGKRVLLVEDLHAFGRIGRSRESESNLALFFQGPLSRGEIALAGACTPEQLQRLEDEAPSFAALFTILTVHPTSTDETLRMVLHEARRLEGRHFVSFDPPAFLEIVEKTGTLWGTSAYPGCALRLLRQLANDYENEYVSYDEVLNQLTWETGLPDFVVDRGYSVTAESIEKDLAERVMGQEEAVAACRELVIRDPHRPHRPQPPLGRDALRGAHRHRQDRARQGAGLGALRRRQPAAALRHERVPGRRRRCAAVRRRLGPGGDAHPRGARPAVLRGAPRRDREGAPLGAAPPAPAAGRRAAQRRQRRHRRLPPRGGGDDLQPRRPHARGGGLRRGGRGGAAGRLRQGGPRLLPARALQPHRSDRPFPAAHRGDRPEGGAEGAGAALGPPGARLAQRVRHRRRRGAQPRRRQVLRRADGGTLHQALARGAGGRAAGGGAGSRAGRAHAARPGLRAPGRAEGGGRGAGHARPAAGAPGARGRDQGRHRRAHRAAAGRAGGIWRRCSGATSWRPSRSGCELTSRSWPAAGARARAPTTSSWCGSTRWSSRRGWTRCSPIRRRRGSTATKRSTSASSSGSTASPVPSASACSTGGRCRRRAWG